MLCLPPILCSPIVHYLDPNFHHSPNDYCASALLTLDIRLCYNRRRREREPNMFQVLLPAEFQEEHRRIALDFVLHGHEFGVVEWRKSIIAFDLPRK
jgi:hypothetical protein